MEVERRLFLIILEMWDPKALCSGAPQGPERAVAFCPQFAGDLVKLGLNLVSSFLVHIVKGIPSIAGPSPASWTVMVPVGSVGEVFCVLDLVGLGLRHAYTVCLGKCVLSLWPWAL